jgi:hypothetical protein
MKHSCVPRKTADLSESLHRRLNMSVIAIALVVAAMPTAAQIGSTGRGGEP